MPKKRINKKPGEMTKSLMRLARENYLDMQREYQRALEEDPTDRATLRELSTRSGRSNCIQWPLFSAMTCSPMLESEASLRCSLSSDSVAFSAEITISGR